MFTGRRTWDTEVQLPSLLTSILDSSFIFQPFTTEEMTSDAQWLGPKDGVDM
jgi:hypothetical protein